MAILPVLVGLSIGCALLYNFASSSKPPTVTASSSETKETADKQKRLKKYIDALENSSVKDF